MPVRLGNELIDAVYLGNERIGAIYLGDTKVYERTVAPPEPVDRPGTLNAGVTTSGRRNIAIAAVVSDPDGIRSIDAATLTARSDGRVVNINDSGDWVRRDANSFTHADTRGRNVWADGTLSVTYTDGNGVQSTLTDTWSV